MVSSPEISRLNGQKSNGPVTQQGKAIASQNARKHGLLSNKVPLLLNEDSEAFQQLLESLIDEHHPESATEHLLIEQIALSWLKLHRLWGAEAAIANLAMLKAQRNAKFPDDTISMLEEFSFKRESNSELEELEARILQAEQQSLAIHGDVDKAMRYEKHVQRNLNNALEQLTTLQQQRHQAGSTGSFRQTSV